MDNRGLLDRPPPALGDGGVGRAVQLGGGAGAEVQPHRVVGVGVAVVRVGCRVLRLVLCRVGNITVCVGSWCSV